MCYGCTAGAVLFDVSNHSDSSDSMLILDAIDLVTERLLEPVPVGDSEPISVQDRLHEHANFWLNELEASAFVKEIVTQGYRIPFLKVAWPVFKCNHRSALEHEEFVTSTIKELVQTGCVVPSDQHTCPVLPTTVHWGYTNPLASYITKILLINNIL